MPHKDHGLRFAVSPMPVLNSSKPDMIVHGANLENEGYGPYEDSLWLLGIEEGFGGRLERPGWTVQRELDVRATWRPTMDAREAHAALCDYYWLRKNYSRVWRNGGKLKRGIRDRAADFLDTKKAHGYVVEQLGQPHGQTFWGELFPLPAIDRDHWPYRSRRKDRETYRRELWPSRRKLWRNRLDQFNPPVVICYGAVVRPFAAELFGVREQRGLYAVTVGATRVVFAPFIGGRCRNQTLASIVELATTRYYPLKLS